MQPIKDFEGKYAISTCGKVTNVNSGKVLKPSLNENGYWYVGLWQEGKTRSFSLHRLLAQAFIPNPENKPFVNHIDADRSNYSLPNLEWCTQSENIKHAYAIGNMSQKAHFKDEELDWLLQKVLQGQTMTSLAEQNKVGLSRLTINLRNRAILTGLAESFKSQLAAQKNARNTQANASKRKPVKQLNKEGELLQEFPSVTAAARALGKSSGSIHNAINPEIKQTTAYGYLWTY